MGKIICQVCQGKGRLRKEKFDFLEDKWYDCMICDGYGFYEMSVDEEEKSTLLDYTKQTSRFRNELEKFGRVFSYEIENKGTEILANVVPKSRDTWIKLVKKLLFVSSGNDLCNVVAKQVFFYDTDGRYKYYWEVKVEVKDLIDLEILSDYVASIEEEEVKK